MTKSKEQECHPLTCQSMQNSDGTLTAFDKSQNLIPCTDDNVAARCKATFKFLRDRNVDVAASFNGSSPSAGKTNMHLDPSIQKAIAAGTAHTLADSTRLDSLYDTPVAGDDLKEHCSSAQGYLSDANSLAIAGLVFLGVGFVTIAMAALRSMMKQTDGFWSSIDYYHKNYQTKEDKPLRLMQFVHRSSNIIGYILIIASGILFFYSLDSSLETYMTSIIFGKWASEAARLNRGSMSEYLPTKTYKFYGSKPRI